MANVAFFINGIGSLKGGGGAERFFADFFEQYLSSKKNKFNLFYYIDKRSVSNLQEVGKLKTSNNIFNFTLNSTRLKNKIEILQLYFFIVFYRIKIIHIPLYNISYLPLLKSISNIPKTLRPKLAINIVNCYVAPILNDKNNANYEGIKNTYFPLFKEVNVDGYFCWNRSFEDYVTSNKVFVSSPKNITSISSRFSDTTKFFPDKIKRNLVVFASRLDEQKHAEWLVLAIKMLKDKYPELALKWKFIICGNGPMREDLINLSKAKLLEDILEFKIEGEMQNILNHSKVYVSCQDYDNFPSLSMAEAMAAGNAVVARNVGQTHLFLKNNVNGKFIEPDNAGGLMEALKVLLSDEASIELMGQQSLELIKNVHTFENFVSQIETFWQELIATKNN